MKWFTHESFKPVVKLGYQCNLFQEHRNKRNLLKIVSNNAIQLQE